MIRKESRLRLGCEGCCVFLPCLLQQEVNSFRTACLPDSVWCLPGLRLSLCGRGDHKIRFRSVFGLVQSGARGRALEVCKVIFRSGHWHGRLLLQRPHSLGWRLPVCLANRTRRMRVATSWKAFLLPTDRTLSSLRHRRAAWTCRAAPKRRGVCHALARRVRRGGG